MVESDFLQIPLRNDVSRKIIHVDMDAFYASIEEREKPIYKTKPLIIARDPRETGGKGVVTTANYLARKFGVHSAMPAQKALELIPDAVFKRPDFPLYKAVSDEIHEIFHEYTDKIEPVAFDEAYLDVTDNKKGERHTVKLAREIQHEIFLKTKLTCSTGISYNKFLAKMASDYRKPVGRTIILPPQAERFLQVLPVQKFHGIGKKTAERMNQMAIYTGLDLQQVKEIQMIQDFGKMGYILYRRVRGIDDRPVEYQRQRKSVGKERTYNPPLTTENQVKNELTKLAEMVIGSLKAAQVHGKTVVLKFRNGDFDTVTKRLTLDEFPGDADQLYNYAYKLWLEVGNLDAEVRLLGITVTNLTAQTFENMRLPLKW